MSDRTPTPGQTVGPFFGFALPVDDGHELVPRAHPKAVRLHGDVLDGNGAGIPDALLEIWQADADGTVPDAPGSLRRDGWTFTGWGRAATDDTGHYSFTTVEPGVVEPGKARFVALVVFARGLLDKLHTRIYLPEDDHRGDPLLDSLGEEDRAALVARREPDGSLRFDVRLQGEGETPFLDIAQGRDGTPGRRP